MGRGGGVGSTVEVCNSLCLCGWDMRCQYVLARTPARCPCWCCLAPLAIALWLTSVVPTPPPQSPTPPPTVDLLGADFDAAISIERGRISLFPAVPPSVGGDGMPARSLPPSGSGLNQPAMLTFRRMAVKQPGDARVVAAFKRKLEEAAGHMGAIFVHYDPGRVCGSSSWMHGSDSAAVLWKPPAWPIICITQSSVLLYFEFSTCPLSFTRAVS